MDVSERLEVVRQRILTASKQAGRNPDTVRLIAVSKTKPTSLIWEAWLAGQQHFGESYVQEAFQKQKALAHLALCWHFIGPLQSNKTAYVANAFSWVHSVDRVKIAKRLSEQRSTQLPPLNICLQVNISQESTKSGVLPGQLSELVEAVINLPQLRLRGLMVIPKRSDNETQQRHVFGQAHRLFDDLQVYQSDTLSMGMSGDLEAAIAEGSTMLRVGAALFEPRI